MGRKPTAAKDKLSCHVVFRLRPTEHRVLREAAQELSLDNANAAAAEIVRWWIERRKRSQAKLPDK